MFFFVNQYLLSSNSSIEHAEMKRLKLFKANHVPAKLVTRDFDPIIHGTLVRFGLDDDQLINLFDFFAQTSDYKGKALRTEDLNLPYDYQVSAGNSHRQVMDGSRQVAEIYFIGGTVGQVDHVDYYDVAGNISLRERFDLRGYKAVDQFFGQDDQIYYERYYRSDGTLYMERHYVQSVQNTPINSLNILRDYHGKDYFFDSFDDLFIFFLNELNRVNGGNNAFVADRPMISIQPVLKMDKNAKKYLWMSISQVDDGQDPVNGPLNNMLQGPLTADLQKWDGIIAMTNRQADDLRQRLGNKANIFTVNGTPVKYPSNRIAMNKRTPALLIYVGRLGEDKQTGQLISMFAQIHQQVPTSRLTLYGYGNSTDVDRYKKQVADVGLNGVVTFAGYQVQLANAYDQAQLFVDASRIDAQPLSMGEAFAHGVPAVSYNYSYGPADMVKAGQNGELIPLNDQQQFVDTVVKLLQNPTKLQELSNGAYANLDEISDKTTWQQWMSVVNNK